MSTHDLSHNCLFFRKSSFSEVDKWQTCVEVAFDEHSVFVRHSVKKDIMLHFTAEEWSAFVTGVKAGEFDL